MRGCTLTLALSLLPALVAPGYYDTGGGGLREDPLGHDPNLETVHLYKGQYPVGIAVSRTGRKFSSFPAGIDAINTNDGRNGAYQVAELTGFEFEKPYPSLEYNNPPGGAIDYRQTPPVTKGLENYLLSVQALSIDFNDHLWMLDAGRVLLNGTQLLSSPGGPKLVLINLATNAVTRTYTFPTTVAKPESYLNDVRVDTRRQFAYITDAGDGTNAIVVLDLRSGASWRVLEHDPSVLGIFGTVPFITGEPLYDATGAFITTGVDGIALSNDTATIYYSVIAGRFLYSVPTSLLRDRNTPASEVSLSVRHLGEKGISGSMVTDSLGTLYAGNGEQSALTMYSPTTGKAVLLVRDKRIIWADSISVGEDRYIYFTVNQINYASRFHSGVDKRKKPYVLFRVRLPGSATKGLGS